MEYKDVLSKMTDSELIAETKNAIWNEWFYYSFETYNRTDACHNEWVNRQGENPIGYDSCYNSVLKEHRNKLVI